MKKQLPKKKAKSEINSVILDGPPPIQRIIKDIESVSAQTIAIYAYLWESAYWSQNLDRVDREFWSDRRDTGGTTHWSIDGLAKQLHIGHTTAEKAINTLIKHGFIRVLHFMPTKKGKKKRKYQIIHPSQIDSVRESLEILEEPYGLCPHKTVKPFAEPIDFEFESFLDAEEEKFTISKWPYGPLQIEWTNFAQLLNKHFKYIDLLAKEECRYSGFFGGH